jgi:two-component system chemotaxis sensor kinase CheA
MDVVKTNIEKIGGTVDLQSQLGRGTTLKIKIPLTLAIIPALTITSGGDRFAIPQVSLLELLRLEAATAREEIERVYGVPVYRLRGKLLPLVYLNRELKLDPPGSTEQEGREVKIVVVQADGHPFGLVVDDINDTQEIVVKPLGKQLKGVACFAGATIMGDGQVALILDVLGLAQQSRVISELQERAKHVDNTAADARKQQEKKLAMLLFSAGHNTRMAIPLSMVARLEKFPRSSIEYSAGKQVVRYRGQILPLIDVSKHLPLPEAAFAEPQSDSLQVVVYAERGKNIGLVVSKIHDIVNEVISEKRHAFGNGILGSIVVQNQVTDLLDVHSVIRAADPSFFPNATSPSAAA